MPTLWETRFNNHPLWTVIDEMREGIASTETPADADLADSLARLQWLMETLQAHREVEDVRGYSPTMLDTVQRHIANVQSNFGQYVADPETYGSYLRQAADAADPLADAMAIWPSLPARGMAQAAGRSYSQYADASKSALEDLNTTVDELRAHLTEIRETVDTESANLTKLRGDFDESADEAIKVKLEEVAQRYLREVEDSITQLEQRVESTQDREAEINQLASRSRNIVEAVSRRIVADDYRKNARNKAIGGWVWDLLGIVVGGTPLVILLVHFFQVDPDEQTGLSLTLTRIGVAGTGLGLAFLCFRRGTSNHNVAARAKNADLRMRTVHGFIANMDPTVQTAILEGMADRIYLQGLMESDTSEYEEGLLEKYVARVGERLKSDDEEPEAPA